MGRLHPRKGVDVLIQAFKAANIPSSWLLIVGPDEGMMERISPMLDARMVVTGYLEGRDRLAAFAAADVFALPAVGEGLPMVILEAMGAGLPVIVSPECYMPEVAVCGAGLEVIPQPESLSRALSQLLTNASLRQEMQQRGRQLVRNHFTWDAVALKLEQVYRSHLAVTE
jgi:poly(glycerol-phosphate) alpha-glucosyltransferase